jgi:hypothetical protein
MRHDSEYEDRSMTCALHMRIRRPVQMAIGAAVTGLPHGITYCMQFERRLVNRAGCEDFPRTEDMQNSARAHTGVTRGTVFRNVTIYEKQTKQEPWPLVRERSIPTDLPPLVDELLCQLLWIEGCRVVSAADPLRPLISVF